MGGTISVLIIIQPQMLINQSEVLLLPLDDRRLKEGKRWMDGKREFEINKHDAELDFACKEVVLK